MTPAQRKALVRARTQRLYRLLLGAITLIAAQLYLLALPPALWTTLTSLLAASACFLILWRVNRLERKD